MRFLIFYTILSIVPTILCVLAVRKIKERIARRNPPQLSMLDMMLSPFCLLASFGAVGVAAEHNANWVGWSLVGFCVYYQLSFAIAFWATFSWGMGTSGPNNFLAIFIGAWVGWLGGLVILAIAAMITGL